MHATITSLQVKPGQMNNFLNIWNRSIYPLVRSRPGVINGYVLTNSAADKAISVIFYQTETQAHETQTSGKFREMLSLAAQTIVLETVSRAEYTVNIQV